MKQKIKFLTLFIVMGLCFIIYSSNTYALEERTSYVNINDSVDLTVGDLSLSNIAFKNNSSTSTQSFGLTGFIDNKANNDINYTSTVYYYDANYNVIAKRTIFEKATVGLAYFNQMSNLTILNNHSIDEINYYSLSVSTVDSIIMTNNTPSQNDEHKWRDYVIDKYDVNIIVNENNTLDITETITAYFNTAKHGIFRTIPLKNKITRLNGTTSTNRTQITNVSVDNEYKVSRENGNYKLQIGSADKTVTGKQTYTIKYTYNLGKDPVKDYDELYYNIIGNEWDTVIGNITFTITMPKAFDASKIGFSSGYKGSTDNSKVKYNINENTITGSYDGILGIGEALTIRCELNEGYFVNAGLSVNAMDYIIFLIPIIFLGIAIFMWYKFGRDDQVVETVEFYPPEGFNSLEVGFLYKGKASNSDVTSLLIYLANKGYIKISEIEEKSLFSTSKGFKITKLKEYDGNNKNEKIFLNGLFTSSFSDLLKEGTETSINEVTDDDLYNNFYITMEKILLNINNKKNKYKIFEKAASSKSIFIILMIIATYCLITIPPVVTYGEAEVLIFALICPVIGFTVMFSILFSKRQSIYIREAVALSAVSNVLSIISNIIAKGFAILWGGMFGGMPWLIVVFPALLLDPIYLLGYIIGIICIIGMIICLKYLPKRTKYGNEILGKLRGFKNYLETAEKDKLEAMVMENPTYFYDILPYTYVLGVSDRWIKQFETISMQAPTWYDSPNAFDVMAFGAFMNTTMVSAQASMSSNPSSSSGGSSGGGSSGGGSGGGGGGSW